MGWYDEITEWGEKHDYNDPPTRRLAERRTAVIAQIKRLVPRHDLRLSRYEWS